MTTASIAAFVLAAVGQVGSAAAQDLPGGTWGLAQAVNLTALSPAGPTNGSIDAVSCASPGNCAEIGTFFINSAPSTPYPFVLSETGGRWGPPAAVPGIASAPEQGEATSAVSCAAPGECAATWTYADANGDGHAWLIDESGGAWGQAQPVTIGTVGTWLYGVSCPAAGDCTAVGDYLDGSAGSGLPFVMDSSAGTWGTPQEVPGVAGLSAPPPVNAGLVSVSCTSAGNCVAGGTYHVSSTGEQPFLTTETGGSWGQAMPVAGMTTLNPAGVARLVDVSCGAPGDCAATGVYVESPTGGGIQHAWVADESGGNWSPAVELAAPAASSRTLPDSVSCAQAYCAVAGAYEPASGGRPNGGFKAFVATYTSGAWTSQDVLGAAASGGLATVVSCGAPGYCTAGGYYYPLGSGAPTAFVTNDSNGTWASSQDVGVGTPFQSQINGLSCTTPGYCTAFGFGGAAEFTVSEATAATVTLQASEPTVTYGHEEAETLTATVSSPAGGTPTGTVTVSSGSSTVCAITLASGSGTCTLTATRFPPGTAQLTATYNGSADYVATASLALTVTVTNPVVATSNVVQVKNRATGKCLNEDKNTGLLSTYTCLPGTYVSLRWKVVTYSDGSKDLVSVQTGQSVRDNGLNQQLSLTGSLSPMRFQNGGIFRFPDNLVIGVNRQGNFVPVIGSPSTSSLNNVRWDFGSVPA